jgi:hypothetical protein
MIEPVKGPVDGSVGTPARRISSLARILSPIRRIARAGGPMKTIPACSQASAKSGFSARNPVPGWIASAPVRRATSMIRSMLRYDSRAGAGPMR